MSCLRLVNKCIVKEEVINLACLVDVNLDEWAGLGQTQSTQSSAFGDEKAAEL